MQIKGREKQNKPDVYLHGSDLENVSLSSRFLGKERTEKAKVSLWVRICAEMLRQTYIWWKQLLCMIFPISPVIEAQVWLCLTFISLFLHSKMTMVPCTTAQAAFNRSEISNMNDIMCTNGRLVLWNYLRSLNLSSPLTRCLCTHKQ